MLFDVERAWEVAVAVCLAAMGGLARLLNASKKRLKWRRIFSELFISGFAGIMVLFLARSSGLTGDWLGLVCGMAGWIGPRILDFTAKEAVKPIGINLEKTEEKKQNMKEV